jgi:hypothetical protein
MRVYGIPGRDFLVDGGLYIKTALEIYPGLHIIDMASSGDRP